ncbi:rab-GTPase-TBC domain-containing protein [Ditylenchus destructor]|uniref:Rab-GTPase-TBC domain-containing protein n=1 Tax=Ditylenchus destructor TaxID=166010 RepID=A0AAD4RC35_9BILA|nr:rab-GTPase-TBC domain-containing protein [Ditylenchus destructor]
MQLEFGAVPLIGCEDGTSTTTTYSNGQPAAPSPSRMLSRFAANILPMDHQNLCQYVELVRCHTAANGVILISEHYSRAYRNEVSRGHSIDFSYALSVIQQICDAVKFCHENRVVVGLLTLDNVLLHPKRDCFVKISQWGLYHVSGDNADVDYVIGSPWYLAPERMLNTKNRCAGSFKSDIWALGIIIVEIFARKSLSEIWGTKQILSVLSAIIKKAKEKSALPPLLDAIHFACAEISTQILPADIFPIVESCLSTLPSKRPSAKELLTVFTNLQTASSDSPSEVMSTCNNNNNGVINESIEEMKKRIRREELSEECFNRPVGELFFLWKLCGSTAENILINRGSIRMKPPVCAMPSVVLGDLQLYGNEEARKVQTTLEICILPSKNVKERLKSIPISELCQSIELESAHTEIQTRKISGLSQISREQTLVVKERDIDYQVVRMRLFSKLLAAYPYKVDVLRLEASKDIPPVYRAATWAALLNALDNKDEQQTFYQIDTFSEQVSDRQLQVDIPRCHQYDELMSSPVAHYKLKVLLKAWLQCQLNTTGYVYWQGLDSLTAPFLVLNFNKISIAFRCLTAFIDRYLHNFFLRDNSEVIQEYLTMFVLLLEFVDPELAAHLDSLDFHPQLYAIPWFLTCFAHVLPLHKLFHLWDSLLLADATFPLFIGIAVLIELRPQLIHAQFNDAILLFSDLPDISIDKVVANSLKFYQSIPVSCTHPRHSARHCLPNLRNLLNSLLNGIPIECETNT